MRSFSIFVFLTLVLMRSSGLCAGTIPVVVDRVLPDHRPGAPVKFGVPFPMDTLKVGDAVQVIDDQQKVVPHQALVTATWDPKGEHGVRWLLVDFATDAGRQYRIVYGADVKAPAADAKPQAADPGAVAKLVDGKIEIDTRYLSGTIDIKKADLFGGLKAAGGPVVEADAERFSAFFVEHETKGVFRSDLDPEPSIVLEETGPIRATVKMDGWYANAAGEKFCRYSIRAHFFKDRPDVKLEHTFIYTGISKEDRIRAMGIQLPQKTGQRGHVWSEGDLYGDMNRIFTSNGKVVLDSLNHDEIELLWDPRDGTPQRRLGSRANALFNYGSASVAIRDGWQQYPWGFEVNEGVMQVQLWPRGERLMDTTFDGVWWFLDEHQKRFMIMTKRAGARKTDEELITRYREVVNATGAAKTHEVWLTFEAPREYSAGHYGGRLWREVENPVIAHADLAWTTSTRALDFCVHTPRNDELFGDEERYLDDVYSMVQQITDDKQWYGWWDWGGYYQTPNEARGVFKDTHGQETWNRKWPKSHYGWGEIPWLSYFRTGDRKWLRYGQTYTLYSADRAFCHHTRKDVNRTAGTEYHYDNSDIHWVGGYGGIPTGPEAINNLQVKSDYIYMYWLTGDRRALDVLKMWGVYAGEGGSHLRWKVGLESGGDIRNGGQQLNRLMFLYEATWDERYLRLAKNIADSFAGIQTEADLIAAEGDRRTENGSDIWRFHTACGWAYEGLWRYYNVTKDEKVKQTLMVFVERSVNFDSGVGWGFGPIRPYTYGYELTKDPRYLDLIRGVMDDYVGTWVTPMSWSTVAQKWTTITWGRALGTLASAPPEWKAKNLPTNVRGRRLRFTYGPLGTVSGYTPPAAYFNEAKDQAWKFRLLFSHGGRWELRRPDGQVAFTSEMYEFPFNKKWIDVEVKPDGQSGTYTLRCVENCKPATGSTPNEHDAKILCDLPVVVGIAGSMPGERAPWNVYTPVSGRSIYFQPKEAGAVVNAAPIGKRGFGIYQQGRLLMDTVGRKPSYDGAFAFPVGGDMVGKILELRTHTPTDQYFVFPPDSVGGLGVLWFEGIPPYVAANAEDYFVPVVKP